MAQRLTVIAAETVNRIYQKIIFARDKIRRTSELLKRIKLSLYNNDHFFRLIINRGLRGGGSQSAIEIYCVTPLKFLLLFVVVLIYISPS
jgi:hypothetical protein